MYFELLKTEIRTLPPLKANPRVTYVVYEGPNGAGKSSVLNLSTTVVTRTLSSTNVYAVVEPPFIQIPQLKSRKTVREFLKDGDAGFDAREPAAIFNMTRRIIQDGVHSDKRPDNLFVKMDQSPHVQEDSIIFSDRGSPSTKVFQVRAETAMGGIKVATEIDTTLRLAYEREYLLPYDQAIFILPVNRQRYDPDDFWEGKFDEYKLYNEEIIEATDSCYYAHNVTWLSNDPTGATNKLVEPVLASAATVVARHLYKNKAEVGCVLEIPFVWEEKGTILNTSFLTEVRSGNVRLSLRNNHEARIEFTDELPKTNK